MQHQHVYVTCPRKVARFAVVQKLKYIYEGAKVCET